MKRLIIAALIVVGSVTHLAGASARKKMYLPLGIVRITKYTHRKSEGGIWTASGRKFRPEDVDRVCAVSRDWMKRKKLRFGDVIVVGEVTTCVVEDTMAKYVKYHRGKLQKRRVDIYNGGDVKSAMDFGVQYGRMYLVR